jgi:plasmid maintenance system antidote protein VapI
MSDTRTLLDLAEKRGLNREQTAVLGNVYPSTIGRIVSGEAHASPSTIVALAKAFGVSATRMKRLCEAHWLDAHPHEDLRGGDGDAAAA